MSRTNQPWDAIARPRTEGMISTLRVDASLAQDMFWGVDSLGRRMLVLHCPESLTPGFRLPELRELEFCVERQPEGAVIALSLIDAEKEDLFRVLCDDLILTVGNVAGGQAAVRRLMERSYRWHHLLRASGRRHLSELEQRGLIAELIVLRDAAIPAIGTESAIAAWHGPFGALQDFLLPGFRVEVKSTEPRSPRKFSVSSEHQLDRAGAGGDVVSLALVEIAHSDDFGHGGETLVEIVNSIRGLCDRAGVRVSCDYEQRLLAAGVSDDCVSQAAKWSYKAPLFVDVGIDFPAIVASTLPTSVSGVKFDCDLSGISLRQALCPFGDLRGTSRDN